uniref:Gfo/Idh/MocA family oxidoreductase n=1 Tax=candidate division WOR-3 bacterium TaxID=2052148 RepID=A0A7C4UGU7_UNCW3
MKRIRTGIIGIGYLGYHHLRNIKKIEYFDIVGINDINKERLDSIASEFSVKPFYDQDKLIEESDAIFILTTTSSHYNIAKKALEKGKHCFVEKPLTFSLEEADELVNLAKSKNVLLQTGYVERFNPAFIAVKKIIKEPLFIESHRLSPFTGRSDDLSVVLDLMVHDIDIVLYFVKSPLKSISATGVPIISNYIDIANARLEFENGATANITASRISKDKMRKIRFFQRYSYISINLLENYAEIYNLKMIDGKMCIERNVEKGKNIEPLYLEDLSFAEAILGIKEPEIRPEEARESLYVATIILEKISESLRKL